MTKKLRFIPAIMVASVMSLTSCDKEEITEQLSPNQELAAAQQPTSPTSVEGRYIVVFKDQAANAPAEAEERTKWLRKKHNLSSTQSDRTFGKVFKGFSARLSASELEKLRQDTSVDFIEPEHIYTVEQTTSTTTTASTQQIPWGIQRVGFVSSIPTLTPTAWIIDSGIQLNHPDLNVDAGRSRSFLSTTTSPNDQNGHGTFCAGIIAAKNNTFGVHGVAPGAKVVALRAMDANGSGTSTSVISALNYVALNAKTGDVVNMSLGGPASTALDNAVKAVANKGIIVVVAAGNSAINVTNVSPARVNHTFVYTISAMSQGNYWASFSNFGNPTVDYCAPGVNVASTTIGSGYASGNGTSFAAPHVAGIALLKGRNILTNGYVTGDPDGTADRIAHK